MDNSFGPSLIDLYRQLIHSERLNKERVVTRHRFEDSGIAPGSGGRGDSDKLANLVTYHHYNSDPQTQARFVAMLKQLGYLPHQAY